VFARQLDCYISGMTKVVRKGGFFAAANKISHF
jgi:hypothetical protein